MKFDLSARNFRALERNTLQGFVDIHFDRAAMLIKECSWHKSAEGKEWIGLPGKPQVDRSGAIKKDERGKTVYVNVIELTSAEAKEAFRRDAVEAVHRLVSVPAE